MDQIDKHSVSIEEYENQKTTRTFFANVFLWMFIAMGITALTSFLAAASPTFFHSLFSATGRMTILGWVVMLAPIVLVFIMSARIEKMSSGTMIALFIVYSVLMGLSLSFIFWAYSATSICKTFLITGGVFGIMAIAGYFTKTDLTKFGSILLIALIGIILATLVNFFTKSAGLDYIISILGVLIFTGLTAYDVQKLKQIGASESLEEHFMTKAAIWGALSLYLDFINLFLFILRLFGSRD